MTDVARKRPPVSLIQSSCEREAAGCLPIQFHWKTLALSSQVQDLLFKKNYRNRTGSPQRV